MWLCQGSKDLYSVGAQHAQSRLSTVQLPPDTEMRAYAACQDALWALDSRGQVFIRALSQSCPTGMHWTRLDLSQLGMRLCRTCFKAAPDCDSDRCPLGSACVNACMTFCKLLHIRSISPSYRSSGPLRFVGVWLPPWSAGFPEPGGAQTRGSSPQRTASSSPVGTTASASLSEGGALLPAFQSGRMGVSYTRISVPFTCFLPAQNSRSASKGQFSVRLERCCGCPAALL